MDIYELAATLGDELKKDERLVALELARKNYENDKQLQALMIEYEVQQTAMQKEAGMPECDTHMIDMIQDRINELYKSITQNEVYLALEKAQDDVNELMNKVNGIITQHITGKEASGCTHNCATCGGCH